MRARLAHLAAGRLAAAADAAACSRGAAAGEPLLLPLAGSSCRHRPSTTKPPLSASAASFASSAAYAPPPPTLKPIQKLLVANRGEIACRVLATARRMGVPTVAVHSDADASARHVALADEAVRLGPSPARGSYLRPDAVLEACARTGADAVHPGYGFLSESADFAEACTEAGVRFVGPPSKAIRRMGSKAEAKQAMERAEPTPVPVVPGFHGSEQSDARLRRAAEETGFPLLVKAVSGGGGKGMRLAESRADFDAALRGARSEALASFGDDRVLVERYVRRPRHVEVQVLADAHGGCLDFGTRDCSLQRRHQKVIEEAPAPGLPRALHRALGDAAVRAALAVGYESAGTVEFLVDADAAAEAARVAEAWEESNGGGGSGGDGGDFALPSAGPVLPPFFYFMEMNTRLQVEHPITEAVCGGIDLVELQLRVAAGERLPLERLRALMRGRGPVGHAFEARLYAESPRRGFLPGAGRVRRWVVPRGAAAFGFLRDDGQEGPGDASNDGASDDGASDDGASDDARRELALADAVRRGVVRVDSGVRTGDEVGVYYDPMIAKVVATGADRAGALARLRRALRETQVAGLPTNLAFLRRLAEHPDFSKAPGPELAAELDTGFIPRHARELLAPEAMPGPSPAALAVAARLALGALMAARRPEGQGARAGPAMSAWAAGDSKRLWHFAEREVEMLFPEGREEVEEEEEEAQQKAGSGPSAGASASASVFRARARILGAGDFDVMPLDGGSGGGGGGALSSSPPAVVEVRGLVLELEPPTTTTGGKAGAGAGAAGARGGESVSARLEATVDGRRVRAAALSYVHATAAASEAVLTLWPLTPRGDAAGPPAEWRWPLPAASKEATGEGGEGGGRAGGGGAGAGAVAGAVRAPMPGRVARVLQEEGAIVARGDPLIVLEAMKMEHTVRAPRAGVVRWPRPPGGGGGGAPRPGQQVQDGAVLLRVLAAADE